jgi:glycerophosphoryl diester phosphodiesterase
LFTNILLLIIAACSQPEAKNKKSFDLQGHRGCRGLMPENTIPAMLKAVDLGVNTLEMDVVITQDSQVILSHEPIISDIICLGLDGEHIEKAVSQKLNIFEMTYDQVKGYDCGSKAHPLFLDQKKMAVSKPLLTDMLDSVLAHLSVGQKIAYNIEIKSTPKGDGIFHPDVPTFCELLMKVLKDRQSVNITTIQSFDIRPLRYLHQKYPEVKLALLSDNMVASWQSEVEDLGFQPDIYSPYFLRLSFQNIKDIQKTGMKVIPWTINEKEDIIAMLEYNVDGIITDYPNRVKSLMSRRL